MQTIMQWTKPIGSSTYLPVKGKTPKTLRQYLFFSHFLPSGKGKSPLQADLICAADFRMRPASMSHKAPYNNT